jgi:hypothetical protein
MQDGDFLETSFFSQETPTPGKPPVGLGRKTTLRKHAKKVVYLVYTTKQAPEESCI